MCPQQPPRGSEIDTAGEDVYVLSYAGLRKAVGYFGLLLPIVVFVVGIALPPHEFLGSISAYYYVPFAGNIFVGALWTIGVFLWFYNYRQPDNILTSAAGTFAIGVATFPTAKQGMPRSLFSTATIHLVCAALFSAYWPFSHSSTSLAGPLRVDRARSLETGYTLPAAWLSLWH